MVPSGDMLISASASPSLRLTSLNLCKAVGSTGDVPEELRIKQ